MSALPAATEAALEALLEQARDLGYLGPGPVGPHIEHAHRFSAMVPPASRVVDLGSGAGVPGLVVAVDVQDSRVSLVDVRRSRTDFLERAVGRLGLTGRVGAISRDVQDVGRDMAWRGQFDVAIARGFGPLGWILECAAPLLCRGGSVVVSVPLEGERVELDPLLGLQRVEAPEGFATFAKVGPTAAQVPRASRRRESRARS